MATETLPPTMKAYHFSRTAGGLENHLTLNPSAPLPPQSAFLPPDHTLVHVLSASLNPVDYKLAELPLLGALLVRKPASPGIDYAGRVVATGINTKKVAEEDLRKGQLVFGRLDGPSKWGTLAEFTVVGRKGCVPVPEGVEVDDAACIGTAGSTAYQCIVPNVKEGDRVFVNGGSGGTGVYGIQFAKIMGCYVVTSCSGANVELCKSLGADEVVDYKSRDLLAELKKMQKFDLVVDNVGTPGELYYQAHLVTTEAAKYVQVGAVMSLGGIGSLIGRMFWPGFLGGGKRGFEFLTMENNYDQFRQIAQWVQQGKVKTIVDEKFEVGDDGGPAIRAFDRLKSGRAKGKIVVRISKE